MLNVFLNFLVLLFGIIFIPYSYYRYYLTSSKGKRFESHIFISVVAIFFSAILLIILINIHIKYSIFLYLILFCGLSILIFNILKNHPPKCIKKEKIMEIKDLSVYTCETKENYVNAWYNPIENAIYLSKELKDILNDREFKVILKHELGHSRENKILLFSLLLMSLFSIIFFWGFVLFVFILSILYQPLSLYYINYLPISVTVSLIGSFLSWILEHRADSRAVESVNDIKYFRSALIKLYLYGTFYKVFNKLEISKIDKILLDRKISRITYKFSEFLREYIKYILSNMVILPFEIIDIIGRGKDIFLSHPPLEFRLLFVSSLINYRKNKRTRTADKKKIG